jgi:hypothetical protein
MEENAATVSVDRFSSGVVPNLTGTDGMVRRRCGVSERKAREQNGGNMEDAFHNYLRSRGVSNPMSTELRFAG